MQRGSKVINDFGIDCALYQRFIGARLRTQMQYRGSFLLMTVVTFLGLSTEFIAILILFNEFGSLAGWEVGEVAFLYGLATISFGLSEMIGAGFDTFPAMIRKGEFDQVLLRPSGVFMQILAADFQLRRIGRISQGMVAMALALSWTSIDWNLWKVLYLLVVIVSGTAMFMAMLVLGATLCFWTVQSIELINILTNGGTELTSYPLPIYHELMQRFFTFIVPLAFVTYFPALFLLDRPARADWPGWMPFLTPLVAIVSIGLTRLAWGFGVRHYRSTGS